MNAQPLVYVVVSNHNGLRYLRECFETLLASDYGNFRVVMMDNASTDGGREFVRENFPSVHVVHNRKNLWFAAGTNVAMKYALDAGAEWVALLNNDTATDPGWIREMVKVALSSPDIGGVASRLMYYTNRRIINGLGVSVGQFAYATDIWQGHLFKEECRKSAEVIGFTGGACLMRADALKKVGLFDPRFKAYFEDIDLSLRIRGAGWRIVTAPEAVIYHKYSSYWGGGSPRQQYMILRNRMLVMMKYFPLRALVKTLLGAHRREQVRLLKARVVNRDWDLVRSQFRAHFSVARFVPKAIWFRLRNRNRFGWKLFNRLVPVKDFIGLPYVRWDYRRPAAGDALPDRILFGVNDDLLGDGWLPLDRVNFPQMRWMGDEAECFLKARKGARSVLQFHVHQPFDLGRPQELSVLMDGEALAKFEVPHDSWRTFQIECVPRRDEARITFKVDRYRPADPWKAIFDSGLRFNEVSLLPEGSPFIRPVL